MKEEGEIAFSHCVKEAKMCRQAMRPQWGTTNGDTQIEFAILICHLNKKEK